MLIFAFRPKTLSMQKVVLTLFAALSACFIWTGCGPELNVDEDNGVGGFFNTPETTVQAAVESIYDETAQFLDRQLLVESYIYYGDWQQLNSSSREIERLWKDGYNLVKNANQQIYNIQLLDDAQIDYYKDQYITHLSVLRDFVLYNMNHLWGGIPLPKENPDPVQDDKLPRSEEAEVYRYILDDLQDALNEIGGSSANRWDAGEGCVSERVIYMLMAECALHDNKGGRAKGYSDFAVRGDDGEFFSLRHTDPYRPQKSIEISVYSKTKASLYSKEAAGDIQDLAASWDETFLRAYGYWAALKRLGIAQQKVHCEEHQLLLPIPYAALMLNENLTQNPGY